MCVVEDLFHYICEIVSETNGITLEDTLELMLASNIQKRHLYLANIIKDFHEKLTQFQMIEGDINVLLEHDFSKALYRFFQRFPISYNEGHIHLTGSLDSEFIFPRLQNLLNGPHRDVIKQKIENVYGNAYSDVNSVEQVKAMLTLGDEERFDRYLKILILPKLILFDRRSHEDAAYHMAKELFSKHNIGHVRLKFTLSRANSTDTSEIIPMVGNITFEDVVLGLYEGFSRFKREENKFNFVLSPCFRKESEYFDSQRFENKQQDVNFQINALISILDKYPFLQDVLCEVDTVGDERNFYRKSDFLNIQSGFRKLQYRGFQIRSHHGETWKTLRRGIQAVDNAMNIWQIDTLEHGLSLGINPNFYFHSLFQRVLEMNEKTQKIPVNSPEYHEISEMLWGSYLNVGKKLLQGVRLNHREIMEFTKTKFHTAREVEHYQHDVLNRMIQKNVSLISLPSSNYKLTSCFADYKDHPFSWWEKKNVNLGVGTDNYITLNTNYIKEMLILLYTDPAGLKITKLLMVTTGEQRRAYLSTLLWNMRVQERSTWR